MTDPVVLIGIGQETGDLRCVGLYATSEAAREAVHRGTLPSGCYWSVMTPTIGTVMQRRTFPKFDGRIKLAQPTEINGVLYPAGEYLAHYGGVDEAD